MSGIVLQRIIVVTDEGVCRCWKILTTRIMQEEKQEAVRTEQSDPLLNLGRIMTQENKHVRELDVLS